MTIHFLADEDLRQQILFATRRLDPAINFETAIERGLSGKTDDEVLAFAASTDYIVVSHDVNTMIAAAQRRLNEGVKMSGLFLVPQWRQTQIIAENLLLIWSASQAEEWVGRIVFLPV